MGTNNTQAKPSSAMQMSTGESWLRPCGGSLQMWGGGFVAMGGLQLRLTPAVLCHRLFREDAVLSVPPLPRF